MGFEKRDAAILVVDDYHAMVLTIHHMLRQLGFGNLFEANDGREAWEYLRSRPYRLVISDLKMRNMDGIELLRLVRADETMQTMPFIMVTAAGERDRVIEARAAGVTDYIVKPFTVATLKAKLAGALGDLVL
jgi:two-component system, chemotaxis family, chemotaxis protein CheY